MYLINAPCTLTSGGIQQIGSSGRRLEGEKRLTDPSIGVTWASLYPLSKGHCSFQGKLSFQVPVTTSFVLSGLRLLLASSYWPNPCPHFSKITLDYFEHVIYFLLGP